MRKRTKDNPIMEERQQADKRLRMESRQKRDALSAEQNVKKSHQIAQQLSDIVENKNLKIKNLLVFYPLEGEVNLLFWYEKCQRKQISLFFPVTDSEKKEIHFFKVDDLSQFTEGTFHVMEPVNRQNQWDNNPFSAGIVPGLVFDFQGNRLGYGGGYYDRFLSNKAPQAVRIGLAFSEQIINTLPSLPHDQKLDMLISEREILLWPGRLHS